MWILHRGLWVAACLLLIAGCGEQPAPSEMTEEAKSAPVDLSIDKTPQSDLEPPADKSLTLNEYIEAGIPAQDRSWSGEDRSWSGEDMARAASTLVSLAQQDASQLPRYQSEQSGKMFKRIISDDNLDLYRNPSVPLDQRLPDAMSYTQSNNQILKLYLAAFNQNAVGDSELVELLGAQLRVSVVMIELVDEFLPTLDKDDPTYPIRMEGLQTMRNGMAGIVTGSLLTLTETHAYRTSELKRFAGYMEATFPAILPALSDAGRSEALIRLRSFQEDPKMQHLKPELETLIAIAEKTATPESAP